MKNLKKARKDGVGDVMIRGYFVIENADRERIGLQRGKSIITLNVKSTKSKSKNNIIN